MNSKTIFLLLSILLLTTTVFAFEFDNVKEYNEETKTVTIKNSFLGVPTSTIGEITLTSEENMVCLGSYCYVEMNVTNVGQKQVFDEFEYYDIKSGQLIPITDKTQKVMFWNTNHEREVVHYIWGEPECSTDKDGNFSCSTPVIGSTTEDLEGEWQEYNINDPLPNGVTQIRIYVTVGEGKKIEWIPQVYGGSRVTEWTTFTGSTLFERQFTNDTRVQSKTSDGSWLAQSFTVGAVSLNETFNLTGVELFLEKSSGCDLGDLLMVSIHNVTAGNDNLPDPAAILSSNRTISCIDVQNESANGGTGLSAFNVTLPGVLLGKGGKYAINVTARNIAGGNWDLSWGQNQTAVAGGKDAYVGGNASETGTVNAFDNWFGVYGTTQESSGKVTVVLNSPADASNLISSTINFNSTATFTRLNPANATIYIYYNNGSLFTQASNTTISGASNTTVFNIGSFNIASYKWNVYYCGTNSSSTICNASATNFTFNYGYQITGQSFNNQTTSLATENFYLNISFPATIAGLNGVLIYNNTNYTASGTQIGNNFSLMAQVPIPNVNSPVNKFFNWSVIISPLSGGTLVTTTTAASQLVNPFFIDNCTAATQLVLNYSLRDEDTRQYLLPAGSFNTSIYVGLTVSNLLNNSIYQTFNMSYNATNPAQVCMNLSSLNTTMYRLDSQARYSALNREVEYYYTQNYTLTNNTIPLNIDLYDLLTVNSQEFKIILKDANFLVLPNAVIEIARQYIPQNIYPTVEAPLTDSSGQTIAHLVLSDEVYNIIVKREGQIIGTFLNQIAICQDVSAGQCTINLNLANNFTSVSNFQDASNLLFSLNFNESSRTASTSFVTQNGQIALISINGTLFDNRGNTTVCASQVSSSSGNLNCAIPALFGNGTFQVQLYSNGQLAGNALYVIRGQDPSDIFRGGMGVLAAIVLFLTLIFLTIGNPILILLAGIVGVGASISLLFIAGGSLLGYGAIILWLIFASLIIIYKINKNREVT